MKKRLWAVPLMALAVVCTLVLSACGGPSVEQQIRDDLTEAFSEISPDNEEMIEAITSSSDGAFEQMGIDPKEFAQAYFDGFTHDIKSVEVDEDAGTATAVVAVKMRSFSAVMADFMTEFQAYMEGIDPSTVETEDELYAKAGELLMTAVQSAELAETDCTFTYEKDEDGAWSATEGAETAILEAMM